MARHLFDNEKEVESAQNLCVAEGGLYYFARLLMKKTRGITWLQAPHHKIICQALERVFNGEIKRLIINIPPRYSKTELALVFVLWSLGRAPDSEYIFSSYSDRLATTNSWRARELAKSEIYRTLFPKVIVDTSSSAKDEWRTTEGGCIYATGNKGTITGYGAGKVREGFGGAIIIDDPLKADDARSELMRTNVLEWYQGTLQSRCNSSHTPIIVIAQRLHEEDLPGWLLAGGTGEDWESIVLPAIQEDGSALWPEKHDIETLRRMERASPYVFAGQYLQRPAPPGGGFFKPAEMAILEDRPKIVSAIRAWDMAGTEGDGDYTSGVLLGRTENDRYVILDAIKFQGAPDEVEKTIIATAYADGYTTRIGLAQDPGQAGKAQLLYMTKKLAGFKISASPESGDKIRRAEPIASQVNLGNVDMVRGDWNIDLRNEMLMFPMGKHDDQIDALSRAFMELTSRPRAMVITQETLRLASMSPRRMAMGAR